MHAGYFRVFIIHRNLTWTTGYVIILMRTYAHGGWAHHWQWVNAACLTWKNSHKIFLCPWLRQGLNLRSLDLESDALPTEPPQNGEPHVSSELKLKATTQGWHGGSIDRSQAQNGRLCRVAGTDLGDFAPAITIRGLRSFRMHSGFTHDIYVKCYVERFTVTPCSVKLVTTHNVSLCIREDLEPKLLHASPAKLLTHNNREKGDYLCKPEVPIDPGLWESLGPPSNKFWGSLANFVHPLILKNIKIKNTSF